MFQNMSPANPIMSASMEIFTMLLGAFVLGMILGWLLKPSFKSETQIKEKKQKIEKTEKENDDLLLIEGIGPKIAKLLGDNGVKSYADILREDVAGLEVILLEGGKKFSMHNPSTWPDQARLAMKGKWSELEEYQEILSANLKKK